MAASGVVLAVSGQEVQGPELIDAQPPAFGGPAPLVQPPQAAVLGPELRVGGVLPGLGVTPAHAACPQELTQVLQGDRGDDLLGDQVLPQLGQRPDTHADQLLGRREGDLGDLLGDVCHELARAALVTVVGIPGDGLDAARVETMNDDADPCGGAAAALGDLAVGHSAERQEDDPGVAGVDRVGQLAFHLVQLASLPWPQLPCHDPIHVGSPQQTAAGCSRWRTLLRHRSRAIRPQRRCAKLMNWKRH